MMLSYSFGTQVCSPQFGMGTSSIPLASTAQYFTKPLCFLWIRSHSSAVNKGLGALSERRPMQKTKGPRSFWQLSVLKLRDPPVA